MTVLKTFASVVLTWGIPICMFMFLLLLAKMLLFRVVLPYPWPMAKTDKQKASDKQTTVVFAGSYNPPHLGHFAMLTYLAQRYGKVIAVVGINPNKKYAVSPENRVAIVQKMVSASPDIKGNVFVTVSCDYIWRYAMKQDAQIMFRGIRSWQRDGNDENLLRIQNTWGPLIYGPLKWPLPTHYLEGQPQYNSISSTRLRELCSSAKKLGTTPNLSPFVPDSVADDIANLYSHTT